MKKLYVIGLGPGDNELITVKAMKALSDVKTVFIPYSTGTNRSLAETIVKNYVSRDTKIVLLGFPMSKNVNDEVLREIGKRICEEMGEGESAFVTLGDPTLYSTFFRVKMPCNPDVEIIPGVSSITACASRAKLSLANAEDSIAIIPASRLDLIKKSKEFETIIILKANENLKELIEILGDDYDLLYAKRCFMKEERIVPLSMNVEDKDYFSMIIAIRRKGETR
ncbi:precorrin-2 C(20)-methyltransferase [Sulfolobus sp. A20]|uniref:cobalt-factor II C(20)-methyltransferase n=1 Tax=Sulfolobaceae TaxID=118883 RepID=UPI000845CE45|nr:MULTISPECIES: cobalt-factor II C(20)-methyltransferase [unclassified Sulfolobus]TRM74404.1 cobalt-factor II C(20)-methyltransferase [Sulfolobus sp. E5]TRM75475.1 cobalt-factor II C(20)-methyltransferase [Sulfolobus sp. A20-N-F8]TRM81143.1 cobalt-factor II C(20)-methyltransferase [Sulfolobus sp. D5]TRM81354.1 cobalt-factor II C(20)-methyltransferase [Sulfolobus sp. F3]TRM82858.1 cobalt-factor II C(20)-methyltransferase [Sulfolobus sp. A20-N-F6]TRN01141.1 cobalt-factor II C(20)-methyltransfe